MKNNMIKLLAILLLTAGGVATYSPTDASATSPHIVINEIAWMGTTVSANNEWMELYNPTDASISISNWTLNDASG